MMTKMSTPVWQRVICGLLSVVGAVALVANAMDGSVHGAWGITVWVFGVFGAVAFGRVAFQKATVCRSVDTMPVPSSEVSRLVEERRQVEAIKAYRAEAAASLHEAKAVIEHYWPNNSSKRPARHLTQR
jgi:Na+/melibiose symporter-like transporter